MPARLGDRALTPAERSAQWRERKRSAVAEYRAALQSVIEAPTLSVAKTRALKALVASFAAGPQVAGGDVDVVEVPEHEQRDDGAGPVDGNDLAGVSAERPTGHVDGLQGGQDGV
jgi:hypothetical protein